MLLIYAKRTVLMVVALGALALGSGCATSRDVMKLDIPQDAAPAASNGKSVFIRTVTDNRRFEENPGQPNIPSLGFEGTGAAPVEMRKRAIARKRNTYGKALGDILLEEPQNVEGVVGELVKTSLRGMGYTVVNDRNQVNSDTLMMDVRIDKFWAWFNPGFWALTLKSEISTTVSVDRASGGSRQQKTVNATAEKSAQVATSGTWAEVYQRAFEEYRKNARADLKDLK